ncbi:MAG: sulfatase-like hydrolase/transferase [Elusimicrobiota bacterium]
MSYKKPEIKGIIALNFLLSSLIFSIYPFFFEKAAVEFLFLIPALFSSVLILYVFLSPLFFIFAFLPASFWTFTFLFGLIHCIEILDLTIYAIFKFHINSMVLNLIFTPGGLSTLDQSPKMILIYLFLFSFAFLMSFIISLKSDFGKKLFKKIIFASLLFLICEKAMSAWAVSSDYTPFTKNFKVYPFYIPLQMRSFMEKYLGIKAERRTTDINIKKSGLNYPLKPLEINKNHTKPNIVIIVSDSLRFDMLSEEIMPKTLSFVEKKGASLFLNHYSAGNATRFGIFSIFYGLYGNYWEKILGERKSPVLMDILNDLGYKIKIFASARVTYPEFDRTCFVSLPYENIFDKPNGNKIEKDQTLNKEAEKFFSENSKNPFFAFIFYDSLHGSYDYPPELEKFSGASKSVDHLFLRPSNINSAFLRYKNSAYFQDFLISDILRFLENKNLIKNTIVIITGDHGEPFFERGYYGHNQGYCDYEIKVPLIFYIPGKSPIKSGLLTSHLDIAPTLLKLLGVKNPVSDFSNGKNLFEEKELAERKFLPAFSWDSAAIIGKEETAVFSMETYNVSAMEFYDSNYKKINRKKNNQDLENLKEFWKESSRFYK